MKKSSRTNASDSGSTEPTRKQIASLVRIWAEGKVTRRMALALSGLSCLDQEGLDSPATSRDLSDVILACTRYHDTAVRPPFPLTREQLQNFLRKPQPTFFGEFKTVIIPASTEPFVASERFKVIFADRAQVKISNIGLNFRSWYMSKREESRGELALRYGTLKKLSTDGSIIAGLGGKGVVETTLSEIYWLMAQQANGEDGALLTNGHVNIFYVRDADGVLRAVDVRWRGGGWGVYADGVENPDPWHDGSQVFSRN